jgi:4-hydroxyphenylacetate 3-monooxygenase
MSDTCKTGAEHIASLRDGRAVFIDGEAVADVTEHPAFRNAVRSVAALYDHQARPENLEALTFRPPGAPRRINRSWQLPRSYDELVQKRQAIVAWARQTFGFLGRSPDHVAATLVGKVVGIEVFRRHGAARAQALLDYFDYVSRNDLFVSYIITNPQHDRAKPAGEQADDLIAQIVDEDSTGITIRGAKLVGTSAILSNEVLIANLEPLRPGEESLAFCCALPMNAPGMRLLSRKSYEAHAVSRFDNPLSSQFDENDALIHFDDVKVPWDRVFVHRDTDMCRAQFHDTMAHTFQNYQAQVRLSVKLKFLVAVGHRIADTIGTSALPVVREELGRLAAQAATIDAMVHGMEAAGGRFGEAGAYYMPHRHYVYAATVTSREMYPRFITALRELAGASVIMLPSSQADLANPTLRRIIERTQRSPAMAPLARVKFLKAAWDAIGSEFASRHTQYEMFYGGPGYVNGGRSYRTYDWAEALGLLDELLGGYDAEPSTGAPPPGR